MNLRQRWGFLPMHFIVGRVILTTMLPAHNAYVLCSLGLLPFPLEML